MSKASKYAEALEMVNKAPRFAIAIKDGTYVEEIEVGRVTNTGYLKLQSDEINPEQALKFAAWINETFGE